MAKQTRTDGSQFMMEACRLAEKGVGRTSPNPPVGALLVKRGRVVGRGWHKKAGTAHAEVAAIKDAGNKARNADLYVTLEPCCTTGRTGPCTEAILNAGISSVTVGSVDPNPKHAGAGLRILDQAGVSVRSGVLSERTDSLIAPFSKWICTGLPYVTLKMAMSIDGRITDKRGESQWISSPASRDAVKRFRGKVDAVMVGATTVVEDNPTLRPISARGYQPLRIAVSTRGDLPRQCRLLSDDYNCRTIIVVGRSCSSRAITEICRTGATVITARESKGRVSLKDALRRLASIGVLHIYCEGGGTLAASLMQNQLVDAMHVYSAPFVLGDSPCKPVLRNSSWSLSNAPQMHIADTRLVGRDLFVEYKVKCQGTKQCLPGS